jgi:F-type H+-transporting ATPase subunit alpha
MPKGLKASTFRNENLIIQVGRISSIGDGIAKVYGFDGVKAGELIEFVGRSGAVVKEWLLKDSVGSVLFGSDSELAEGDLARRTKILFLYP